jgi:hypothetical protein
LREPFDCLLSKLSALLLLSCVVPCCQETADTRRVGLLDSASSLAAFSFLERLHALSSFQRTKDCFPSFPSALHPISWILLRPFLGELCEFTAINLSESTLFFALCEKTFWGDLLRVSRRSRPRTSRQSRLTKIREAASLVNPFRNYFLNFLRAALRSLPTP